VLPLLSAQRIPETAWPAVPMVVSVGKTGSTMIARRPLDLTGRCDALSGIGATAPTAVPIPRMGPTNAVAELYTSAPSERA
jgi:hypothetical protein